MARGGDITGQTRRERHAVPVRSASVQARRGIRAVGSASSTVASSEVGELVHPSPGQRRLPALHRNAMKRGHGGNTGIAIELLGSRESLIGLIRRALLERVVRADTSSEATVQASGPLLRTPRVLDSSGFGQARTARTWATRQAWAAAGQLGTCSTRSNKASRERG